jgi:hypothetical protein
MAFCPQAQIYRGEPNADTRAELGSDMMALFLAVGAPCEINVLGHDARCAGKGEQRQSLCAQPVPRCR